MNEPRVDQTLVVLYDGGCGFCMWMVGIFLRLDRRGIIRTAPIQSSLDLLPGMDSHQALKSFHVVDSNFTVESAGLGLSRLMRSSWALRRIGIVLGRFPAVAEWLYRQVASRRGFFARAIPESSKRRAKLAVERAGTLRSATP